MCELAVGEPKQASEQFDMNAVAAAGLPPSRDVQVALNR